MKKIIIVGCGSHSAELRDYIDHYNNSVEDDRRISVLGYIDDNKQNHQKYKFKEPYLGLIKDHQIQQNVQYLMGIANHEFRKKIIDSLVVKGALFTGFIHPLAIISPSATIHPTSVISHNASVGPLVQIGAYNILNSRCTIGHDSVLGDYNFISPQVAISGTTKIGNQNLIGTNSCTIPGITIGDNNKIAAGMVIYKPVGNNETIIFRHKEKLIIRKEE